MPTQFFDTCIQILLFTFLVSKALVDCTCSLVLVLVFVIVFTLVLGLCLQSARYHEGRGEGFALQRCGIRNSDALFNDKALIWII